MSANDRPIFTGPRSGGAISQRRVPQSWPQGRHFRILAIDGGGIRGVFPAAILAAAERDNLGGRSIAGYFDLIVGTSTGGIISVGLGAGMTAADLLALYIDRGHEIFPTPTGILGEGVARAYQTAHSYFRYRYDAEVLKNVVADAIGTKLFGQSRSRLCVPSFDGKHSEVFVFKTPHHPDYKFDRYVPMVDVCISTAAASTFFRPHGLDEYVLVDGGVWANNPIMLGVIEALTCWNVSREQIDVLSIGCGDDPYIVSGARLEAGGLLAWRDIAFASMRLQSLSATNQARLLLSPPNVYRLEPPVISPTIELDDYGRAVAELVPLAEEAFTAHATALSSVFFADTADDYTPVPDPRTAA